MAHIAQRDYLTKDTRDELGLTHASKCVAIDDGYVFCRDRSKAIGKKDVEKLIEFKDAITIKEPDASIYLACEHGATKEARALLSESEITIIQIQNFDDDGSIIEIEDTANDDNANDDDNEA